MQKLFTAVLQKIDEAKKEVWGVATQEVPDCSGEVFHYETSKPYFQAWSDHASKITNGKSLGNLRYMHQLDVAGKLIAIDFDDVNKKINIGAKITDDQVWKEVVEGALAGFSIGGSYVKTWKDDDSDFLWFTAKPSEISVCDLPCCPAATFEMVKADGATTQITSKPVTKKGGILFHYGIKDGKSEVQSVLFDKEKWTKAEAKAWLKENNYTSSKFDESDDYFHFTQHDPGKYDSIRTGKPGDKTVEALVAKEAKTKRVDGEDLPASAFLIVGDKEDTSTWKLPVKFSTDEKTKSHLRNALARFNQLKDVSEEEKAKAYKRLKSLCEKYGIEVSEENKAVMLLDDIAIRMNQSESVKSAAAIFQALAKKTQIQVVKSMYDVADLACLLLQIRNIQACQRWEADMEGGDEENYAIAEALGTWLADGVEILKDIVDEETSELTAA